MILTDFRLQYQFTVRLQWVFEVAAFRCNANSSFTGEREQIISITNKSICCHSSIRINNDMIYDIFKWQPSVIHSVQPTNLHTVIFCDSVLLFATTCSYVIFACFLVHNIPAIINQVIWITVCISILSVIIVVKYFCSLRVYCTVVIAWCDPPSTTCKCGCDVKEEVWLIMKRKTEEYWTTLIADQIQLSIRSRYIHTYVFRSLFLSVCMCVCVCTCECLYNFFQVKTCFKTYRHEHIVLIFLNFI